MHLKQLLQDCKQQKTEAQKRLYEYFADPMFLLCRRYMKTDEAAEEAMMNGFLKFFQALTGFEYINDKATIGWLRKIMVNECLAALRKHNSFLQVALEEHDEPATDDSILHTLSANEIFVLITQLPTGYRTVFNLAVIEEMTHKEIAQALGISEGTSRSQLSKAKQMLQQLLIKNNAEYACRKTK